MTLLETHAGMHPSALLQRMLPLLAPSASFAVWCPFLQPLAEAMQEMQARRTLLLMCQHGWCSLWCMLRVG